jgi:hypothetical protein
MEMFPQRRKSKMQYLWKLGIMRRQRVGLERWPSSKEHCFSRGPRFNSQHPHGSSQLCVSVDLTHLNQTQMQAEHTFRLKKKKKKMCTTTVGMILKEKERRKKMNCKTHW